MVNLDMPSTHQHCERGSIACNSVPECKNDTDPGTLYISKGPEARVRSVRVLHGSVPEDDCCGERGELEDDGREPGGILNFIMLACGWI